MNHRNSNRGVGRLTGRSEVDAGVFRYRKLLAKGHYAVARTASSRLSRFFRSSPASRRRTASAVTAVLAALLVLGVVVAVGQVALEFTPGAAGGSPSTQVYKAEGLAETSDSAESLVLGAGSPALEARFAEFVYPGPYDGSPDNGPARLTP
jgi:hypothetical protein